MATRPTRKAGILQTRGLDPGLQRTLDAIIERLEVLNGLRGDALDQAVTFRDLSDSNFKLSTTGGGAPQIINTPPVAGGDGPTPGPTTPVSNVTANETYLALLISWTNPNFNLQHNEIWRNTVDDLTTAVQIGVTVNNQFMDYVGAKKSYYYWVRAVATDGSKAAYTALTDPPATTGVDPGQILLDPDNFQLQDGVNVIAPFLVGEINGEAAVGLSGQFIVDGSIRARHIVAGEIGAEHISVESLSAIKANMGTLTAGLIQTDPGEGFAYRVELEATAGTAFPIWYGSNAKSSANGRFYVDQNGQVVVKGLLNAGMIQQSFFAPATTGNNSFRIACDYPSNYTGGVYTGKAAHINPVRSTTQATPYLLAERDELIFAGAPTYTTYVSPTVTFLGPGHPSVTEYGRLGSSSELILLTVMVTIDSRGVGAQPWDEPFELAPGAETVFVTGEAEVDIQFQYQGDTQWSYLTTLPVASYGSGSTSFSMVVSTRETAFDYISFRYRVRAISVGLPQQSFEGIANSEMNLTSSSLVLTTSNLGYADNTLTLLTQEEIDDTPLAAEELEAKPGIVRLPGYNGFIIP